MQFTPRPYQERGIAWLASHRRGILKSPARSGKTLICAGALDAVIRSHPRTRKVRIGWMAPTLETRDQGLAAIAMFPLVSAQDVQVSCVYSGLDFGELDVLIVDEMKHSDAPIYKSIIEKCNGARWGLDATPFGEDEERNQARRELFGNNVFTIERSEVQQNLASARVIIRDDSDLILKDSIDNEIDKRVARRSRWWKGDPQQLWGQVAFQVCMEMGIIGNQARNAAAVQLARQHASASVLMLVSQVEHGESLAAQIPGAKMCFSKMGKKKRAAAMDEFKAGELRCMVATSLADEGLDLPNASVLILVSGGRSKGRTEQRSSRVLTEFAGKSEGIIYDFADRWHNLAAKHSRIRQEVYQQLGYRIE